MNRHALNEIIQTPNGAGVVQGELFENGYQYVLVRHTLSEMTGTAKGRNITPQAKFTGLWCYEECEVCAPEKKAPASAEAGKSQAG
jgi:hypothetical protein